MHNDKRAQPLKRLLKIILIVLCLPIVAVLMLLLYLTTPYFTAHLGTFLTHKSGRNIALQGKFEMHLLQHEPRFAISNIKVGNAEWSKEPYMFEADRIEIAIRPWQLLRGRLVLSELTLDRPHIVLEKNEKGDANWRFSQNPQAQVIKQPVPDSRSGVPIVEHLMITDGKLAYHDPAGHINTDLAISTVKASMGTEDAIGVHGKGTYQNDPFTLDIMGASVLELRDSKKPFPFSIHTTIGKTHADVKGTVVDPVKMESFDVTLDLGGANAADLFPITGIALPPTPKYEVRGHLTHAGTDWTFDDFHGLLGGSDLKGKVIWHPEVKPPYFEGTFVSDNLDVKDLSGFVGANSKPADTSRVIPDTPLDTSRLNAMNADVSFKGKRIKASSLLENISMNISLKDGVLTVHPLAFGMADSTINANIAIDGKKAPPQVTLDLGFKRLSLNALFQPLAKDFGKENVNAGLLAGNVKLEGAGKSLRDILATSHGAVGIAMEGGALSHLLLDLAGLDIFRSAGLLVSGGDSPVPMHCVVGDFAVTDGIVNTNAFLVNSDVNNIRAKGTVNLKDETMDLRFYVYPKEATLISARVPLHLDGSFKHPSAGPDKVALAERGGIAAVLGTFLTPPAALLAFIEPGLGSKGDCAGVIRQMDADQAHAKETAQKAPHKKPRKVSGQ